MSRSRRVRAPLGSLLATLALLMVAACGTDSPDPAPQAAEPEAGEASGHNDDGHEQDEGDDHEIEAYQPKPLRPGERRQTLTMPASYTPSAPNGVGTDDYRCFLLDPGLKRDAYLTGTFVQPGNAEVVHHVILFRVPPEQVDEAQALDDTTEDEGWTCFGNSGLGGDPGLDNAPWLGAWAPGGEETVQKRGFGVRLDAGSQIVMQVHYNLLGGPGDDVSSTLLRLAPGRARLTNLETVLLPAPVELPCRARHSEGPLCDRDAALADVKARFGDAGNTADLLHLLCGTKVRAGPVQTCTRVISEPTTIRAVAGHMHLLGRQISIEVNPGTPKARTILDIPIWNFDDQGARPIDPVQLQPFDTVRVTCRHVQWLRDRLPAFEGQPDRYVVWGEGTTDEMCLGILQVTRP
jgi:hypothetical protein